MSPVRFDGRVAIVTGAGAGLGRSHALGLGRLGASVVVNDVGAGVDGRGADAGRAHEVVEEIRAAGGTAVAASASVADPDGASSIVQTALDEFGRVDVLVNNAGILRDRSFAKMSLEEFEAVLSVHLLGAFHVTKCAYTAMTTQKYGRIVFTSSATGTFGNFGQANYGAAKAGLIGLSNVIAIEGARHGITSNVLLPMARTRMTEELLSEEVASMLDPAFVTPLVLYLASEQCTVTQSMFSAGMGRYARAFIGVGEGWRAGVGAQPTADDLAEHWSEVYSEDGYLVPTSAHDELVTLKDSWA